MLSGTNYDHIWVPTVWGINYEHCSKHLELYLHGMAPTLPIWNDSQLYLPAMSKLSYFDA